MTWNTKDKLPAILKCKLSGQCMSRYEGPRQEIDIKGGVIITLSPGDYAGFSSVASEEYIRENPQNYEIIQE